MTGSARVRHDIEGPLLTDEARDAPPLALTRALSAANIPAERFVAAQPGGVYDFGGPR